MATDVQRTEQERAAEEADLAAADEQIARAVRDAQDDAIEVLPPPRWLTHAWAVELQFPRSSMILGGMPADQETRAKIPWKERYEGLRELAAAANAPPVLPGSILDDPGKLTEELPEGFTEETLNPLPAVDTEQLVTVFRRDARHGGGVALAANQVRTALQAAAAALYEGQTKQYFKLRKALRANFRVDPTLLPLWGPSSDTRLTMAIAEPTGIIDLPRPIRRPPFERSVVTRAEYVEGPFSVSFQLGIVATGNARVMTGEVIETLLSYVGEVIGLGSHRGLDNVRGLEPGMFVVSKFESVELEVSDKIPTLKAPPGTTTD